MSLSPSVIGKNTHCNSSRTANKSARSSTKTGLLLSVLFLSIGIIYAAAAAEQYRLGRGRRGVRLGASEREDTGVGEGRRQGQASTAGLEMAGAVWVVRRGWG